MHESKTTKDADINVTCLYNGIGGDVSEIVLESFILFVRNKLRKRRIHI